MMVPVIDMHCDTVSEIFEDTFKKKPEARRHLRRNNLQVDLERMKAAGYMCQCFAIFEAGRRSDLAAEFRKRWGKSSPGIRRAALLACLRELEERK